MRRWVMRTGTLLALGIVLVLASAAFSDVARADSPNWDAEKTAQVGQSRCADAGPGTLGDIYLGGVCYGSGWPMGEVNSDGQIDVDPGASGSHNHAVDYAPGA